ncbi:MAG: DUF1513 domain-containing protein [Pseudomonadota bacterium]
MATRRDILRGLAVGLGVTASTRGLAQPFDRAAYIGVETSAQTGVSRAVAFSGSGARTGQVPLDFRAHGMTQHGAQIVVFPRRPGDRFVVVGTDSLAIEAVVEAPHGRHFYGHGAFTGDGHHLLVPENDLNSLQGGLGLYAVGGEVRRVGQIQLPDSGPHEIIRAPDRDLFYIALGGLMTHPDYGRTPLNLDTFRSQLLQFDFDRGSLEPMGHWAGTEGVSLRHLALDTGGKVYVGGQREFGAGQVLWRADDRGAEAIDTGEMLKGYVSSIATHGDTALVSSKDGNVVLTLSGGDIVQSTPMDGAGAVGLGPNLAAMSGYGLLNMNAATNDVEAGFEFDNHGLVLKS